MKDGTVQTRSCLFECLWVTSVIPFNITLATIVFSARFESKDARRNGPNEKLFIRVPMGYFCYPKQYNICHKCFSTRLESKLKDRTVQTRSCSFKSLWLISVISFNITFATYVLVHNLRIRVKDGTDQTRSCLFECLWVTSLIPSNITFATNALVHDLRTRMTKGTVQTRIRLFERL
jgi:hypothetical protein